MLAWADLSTFDVGLAKRFYRDVLGWGYGAGGAGYLLCRAAGRDTAGLFSMPQKFRDIGMPSFWMSYIRVDDLDAAVESAETHGARIEVRPESAPGGGRIALIRDPAGAGFTCIEGGALEAAGGAPAPGERAWHELHVSDLERVRGFYNGVFGWEVQPTAHAGRYGLIDAAGQRVAGVQVTPNALKGDKQYWGVYFAVDDLGAAAERVRRAGGEVAAEQPLGAQQALLAYDAQGAAFYLVASEDRAGATPQTRSSPRSSVRWRAAVGLVTVVAAVMLDLGWVWGVLCLAWVVPDLRRGATYLFEEVERRRHPVLYALIVTAWVLLGAYLLLASWSR